MQNLVNSMNGILWSNYMIYLCLGTGLFLTLGTRFVQVRHIKNMVKLVLNRETSEQGISSFQAFMIALSGRVGTGNIVGVATAIAAGGPGAVFWMWILAILGAATSFAECTLAQVYKEEKFEQYRGGPAYYIKHGMKIKWLSTLFAVVASVALIVLMPGVSSNAISSGLHNAFGISKLASGIVMTAGIGYIIFGGVRRIGRTAEILVPIMAILYLGVGLVIIIVNIGQLGEVFGLIFASAFGRGPIFGGIVGTAISMGVKRGIYSSEAGMGTAAHHAGAAEVSHPAKQGLVQAFSVYIDTLMVCTATALMILLTDAYNVIAPGGGFLVNNLGNVEVGAMFTQKAVETLSPGFGSAFVAISLVLFAFTSSFAGYYIGETNVAFLLKGKNNKKVFTGIKVIYMCMLLYSSVNSTTLVWSISDMGVGMMVWLNLIAILALSKVVFTTLKDYDSQIKQGIDPVFDPKKLGIETTGVWDQKKKETEKTA